MNGVCGSQIKKAVIVWGKRNSGKTTTLLNFVNQYNIGNNNYTKLMNKMYHMQQNKDIFVRGMSPSESGASLQAVLQNAGHPCPNLLVVAEQIGGGQMFNTLNFLHQHNYKITHFAIAEPPLNYWGYNPNGVQPTQQILNQRTSDIFNAL